MAKVTYVVSNSPLENSEVAVPIFNASLKSWQATSGQDQGQHTIRNPGTLSRLFIFKTVGGSAQRINLELPYSTEYISLNPTANTLTEDNSSTQALSDETAYVLRDNATANRTTRFAGFTFEPDSGLHFTIVGFYGASNSTANSETRYWPGQGSLSSNTTDITAFLLPNDISVTAKNFFAKIYTNTRSTNTTLRFRKNQANGNGVIVVAAGVTGMVVDASNTDSLTAGDEFNYSRTTSTGGGSFAIAQMGVELHSSNDEHHMYGMEGAGADRPLVDSTTLKYFIPFGGLGPLTTTEAETKIPIGHNGVASKFRIKVASSSTTNDATLTIRKNGTDMITIPITAATNGIFSDTSNEFSFSTGDLISASIKLDSGTGSFQIVMMSMVITQGPTEVAVTKSLKYTIIKENAVTKSLKYTIDREQAITKSLKYCVIEENAITKSLTYEVISSATPTVIQKDLTYAVLTQTAITKSLAYYVDAEQSIQKSLTYKVVAPVGITKNLTYTVISPVAVTKDLQYEISRPIHEFVDNFDDNDLDLDLWVDNSLGIVAETDQYLQFTIPGGIADIYSVDAVKRWNFRDDETFYRIHTYGDNTDEVIRDLRLELDEDYAIIYRMIGKQLRVIIRYEGSESQIGSDNDSGEKWLRIRHEEGHDKLIFEENPDIGYYNFFEPGSWNLDEEITDFSTTYPTLYENLGKLRPRIYIQAAGGQGEIVYRVDDWNYAKRTVVTTLPLTYKVITDQALTKSLTYRVATEHVVQKSLQYVVVAEGAITKSLTYTVKTPQAITKSLTYEVANAEEQTITKSLTYAVVGPVAIQKNLSYAVAVENAVQKTLTYHVVTGEALTKTLTYKVVAPVAIQKSLTYEIETSAALQKSLTYLVTAQAQIQKALTYHVVTDAAITKSLRYVVTAQAEALTKSLRYLVTSEQRIEKSLSYRITEAGALTKSVTYRVLTTHGVTKSLTYDVANPNVCPYPGIAINPYTSQDGPYSNGDPIYTPRC